MDDQLSPPQLEQLRAHWGCILVRQLPDGSVAGVIRLVTTTAIMLGLEPYGWARRFCFTDPGLCYQRFAELQSEDDTPEGWFARRPEQPCDWDAKNTPGYLGGDPALPSNWATK